MNVAFIGLGIMGSRMANNLLRHEGIALSVFNRSPEAMAPLKAAAVPGRRGQICLWAGKQRRTRARGLCSGIRLPG